jgi:hypothetical protein
MLSDHQTLVIELTRDDAAKIQAAERDRAIDLAVKRYSKDRPRETTQDVTPEDANHLPLPALWETDFSELRSLEYPIGSVPPNTISQERYSFYRSPTAVKLQLLDAVAIAANNVRATFTVRHALSMSADTIPVEDREPIACWAAAILCDELAALYSGNTDSTIQADSVQQTSKAQEYSARAKALRKRYMDELGVEDKRSEPAGVVVNLDFPDSQGQDRLTHRSAFR